MKAKQALLLVSAVWLGCAFWAMRSLKAHADSASPDPEDDAVAEDDRDDDDDEDDRTLGAVWSDHDQAFAVGERGAIYHSSDAGRVWVRQETGVEEDLNAVWGAHGHIYAVGERGRILRSSSEGVWQPVDSGSDADLHAVWGRGGDDVWAAGDEGVVLHSRDGGLSWKRVDSGTDEDLRAIAGAPGGVYVSGDNGALKRVSDGQAVSTSGGAPAPQG